MATVVDIDEFWALPLNGYLAAVQSPEPLSLLIAIQPGLFE